MRLTVSLLLVLCILPFVTAHEPAGMQNPQKSPKTVLFTPAITGRTVAAAAFDNRANLKSSDGLSKDALIIGQKSTDSADLSIYIPTDFRDRSAQCPEHTAIGIRAPPYPEI